MESWKEWHLHPYNVREEKKKSCYFETIEAEIEGDQLAQNLRKDRCLQEAICISDGLPRADATEYQFKKLNLANWKVGGVQMCHGESVMSLGDENIERFLRFTIIIPHGKIIKQDCNWSVF